MKMQKEPSSFRDPGGFVFYHEQQIYRAVCEPAEKDYRHLMDSGLYKELVSSELLIPHEESSKTFDFSSRVRTVISPEKVPFISYPYEWCFSQLKAAALATLEIQRIALKHGMSLKDASAYNIQRHNGKTKLIDTLSFEIYEQDTPWKAYRQFCQHFLGPLALMSKTHVSLGILSKDFIDGMPLDLCTRMLPSASWFNIGLLTHIHLHARQQQRHGMRPTKAKAKITKIGMAGIIDNLRRTTEGLKWTPKGTEWAEYYDNTNYSSQAFSEKHQIVDNFIQLIKPKTVWDIGANEGEFSRIASKYSELTVSFDIDPSSVEKNYLKTAGEVNSNIIPLVQDLTNPSPWIGWAGEERASLQSRGPADLVMSLALVHHLAISNNVPLDMIACFMSQLGKNLIIEFIPKNDSQVQHLLRSRQDIFNDYNSDNFEAAFQKYFTQLKKELVSDSSRTLYLFRRNDQN